MSETAVIHHASSDREQGISSPLETSTTTGTPVATPQAVGTRRSGSSHPVVGEDETSPPYDEAIANQAFGPGPVTSARSEGDLTALARRVAAASLSPPAPNSQQHHHHHGFHVPFLHGLTHHDRTHSNASLNHTLASPMIFRAGSSSGSGPATSSASSSTAAAAGSSTSSSGSKAKAFRQGHPAKEPVEIHVDSDVVVSRGVTGALEPGILSGSVVLTLAESTNVKDVVLELIGKARVPTTVQDGGSGSTTPTLSSSANPVLCVHRQSLLVASDTRLANGGPSWGSAAATVPSSSSSSASANASGSSSSSGSHAHSHSHTAGKQTIPPGVHFFPFRISMPQSLPASMTCYYAGGSVYYKLKATVTKQQGAFKGALFGGSWVKERKVAFVKTFGNEAMEFTQTLEVENTWPGKIMYSLLVPCRAYAAGDKIPVLARFTPTGKGVTVKSINVEVQESVNIRYRAPTKGGPYYPEQNITRTLTTSRWKIDSKGKAVPADSSSASPRDGRATGPARPLPASRSPSSGPRPQATNAATSIPTSGSTASTQPTVSSSFGQSSRSSSLKNLLSMSSNSLNNKIHGHGHGHSSSLSSSSQMPSTSSMITPPPSNRNSVNGHADGASAAAGSTSAAAPRKKSAFNTGSMFGAADHDHDVQQRTPTHSNPTTPPIASEPSSSSAHPNTTSGMREHEEVGTRSNPYMGDSEINTRVSVRIPGSASPSHVPVVPSTTAATASTSDPFAHVPNPITVTHKIRFSIMLTNLDGHTSELRCALPIHVLDTVVRGEARRYSRVIKEYVFPAARWRRGRHHGHQFPDGQGTGHVSPEYEREGFAVPDLRFPGESSRSHETSAIAGLGGGHRDSGANGDGNEEEDEDDEEDSGADDIDDTTSQENEDDDESAELPSYQSYGADKLVAPDEQSATTVTRSSGHPNQLVYTGLDGRQLGFSVGSSNRSSLASPSYGFDDAFPTATSSSSFGGGAGYFSIPATRRPAASVGGTPAVLVPPSSTWETLQSGRHLPNHPPIELDDQLVRSLSAHCSHSPVASRAASRAPSPERGQTNGGSITPRTNSFTNLTALQPSAASLADPQGTLNGRGRQPAHKASTAGTLRSPMPAIKTSLANAFGTAKSRASSTAGGSRAAPTSPTTHALMGKPGIVGSTSSSQAQVLHNAIRSRPASPISEGDEGDQQDSPAVSLATAVPSDRLNENLSSLNRVPSYKTSTRANSLGMAPLTSLSTQDLPTYELSEQRDVLRRDISALDIDRSSLVSGAHSTTDPDPSRTTTALPRRPSLAASGRTQSEVVTTRSSGGQ